MRWLWVSLVLGCTASAPVQIIYQDGEIQSIEVSPRAYGRQCFDMTVDGDEVSITYAVDASSDWAGVRAIPAVLPEVVTAVMAVVKAPIDLIASTLGKTPPAMQVPSPVSACSAIFEE